jgi:HNH endonuclease
VKTIPLSKGKVAIIDDEDFGLLSKWKWYADLGVSGVCYAKRSVWVSATRKQSKVGMHNVIMQTKLVDHVNGDGLDNRRCNLRECTYSQNNANRRRRPRCASRFRGVGLNRRGGKQWHAVIYFAKRAKYLGRFDSEEAAARAYDAAATCIHGEFAQLNFPSNQ